MFARLLLPAMISLMIAACASVGAEVRYGRIVQVKFIGEDSGLQHLVVKMDDGGTVESTQISNALLLNGTLVAVVPDGSEFWVRPR